MLSRVIGSVPTEARIPSRQQDCMSQGGSHRLASVIMASRGKIMSEYVVVANRMCTTSYILPVGKSRSFFVVWDN